MDNFQFKFDVLKHEMDAVQNGIHTYGKVQFTIKGWAITLFSGFTLFAVQETQPIFLGLCALAVILFWILDSIFKSIQQVYIERAGEIEEILQNVNPHDSNAFRKYTIPGTELAFKKYQGLAQFKSVLNAAFTFQLGLLYIIMLFIIGLIALSRI